MAEQLGLPKLIGRRGNRPAERRARDLVLAMIAQRNHPAGLQARHRAR